MGNVCEGDKYTGATDCVVVRLAAGTCNLRRTGALEASRFLRIGVNYPTGRRLKCEAKHRRAFLLLWTPVSIYSRGRIQIFTINFSETAGSSIVFQYYCFFIIVIFNCRLQILHS